jgi:lipopolysaccharide/colanic/teichoic acid biosynthesis glycosyltransferase
VRQTGRISDRDLVRSSASWLALALASAVPFVIAIDDVHVAVTTPMMLVVSSAGLAVIATAPQGSRRTYRAERLLRAAVVAAAMAVVALGISQLDGPPRVWPLALATVSTFALLTVASWSPRTTAAGSSVVLPPLCAATKRAIDLLVAVPVLVLTAPVVVGAAALVARETRGGWLFRQVRLGRDGRPFNLYKIRSMVVDNDDTAHREYVAALISGSGEPHNGVYKLVEDPRVTRVGAVLRRLSIDELPQLLNVVRGEMSLVGPRPPLPSESEYYDESTWERLKIKPGLTGLWQVSGRSRLGFAEMVELDVRYWKEWTPLLDIAILLRTPAAVFGEQDTA